MKHLLITLILGLLASSAMAHGLIRNELWIMRDAGQLRMKVAATLDEILLVQGLHADHEEAVEARRLQSALQSHADYMKTHLTITDAGGNVVPLTLAKLETTPALASQMLPASPESGRAAVSDPAQRLNPETTRVSYEFIASLPESQQSQTLELKHTLLGDIPAALSVSPTTVVYKTRIKSGKNEIISSQLRLDDALKIPATTVLAVHTEHLPAATIKASSVSPLVLGSAVLGLLGTILFWFTRRWNTLVVKASLLVCAAITTIHAQPVQKVYLAPDDHTDFIWTASENDYNSHWVNMLDYYVAQADAHLGNAPQFQSRFTTDGSYWLWQYKAQRSAAQFEHLMERIQSGHVSSTLSPLCISQGVLPAEAALRQLYYAGRLERQWNVRFPLVASMENQTMPLGVGSLWAGSGAKYIYHGVCACATEVPQLGERARDIYRWKGRDGSSLLMKWYNSYGNDSLGGYAEARQLPSLFNGILNNPTSDFNLRYAPYRELVGAFGQGWDDASTTNLNILNYAQANSTPTQQIIVSNEIDFFEEFETRFGSVLEEVSLSFGNEWDTWSVSLQEVSARVKRAVEKLRAAEAMTTLVSLKNPAFLNGTEAARDLAFMNMGLYFEHDFSFGGPGASGAERIQFHRDTEAEVSSYVNTLHADAATALGTMIAKTGTNLRFYAFNPLSWVRTDFADFAYSGSLPVHVVDVSAANAEVPSQIVTVDGTQFIRIWAENIPSLGYKVYEVRSGNGTANWGTPVTSTVNADDALLENANYKLTINKRGAIIGMEDKTRSYVELAAASAPFLNDLGDLGGNMTDTITVENSGPVSVTLVATSSEVLAHTSYITLFRSGDRVDIRNDINQTLADPSSGSLPPPEDTQRTYKFNFNLYSPDVWHEEAGAVLHARREPVGHYSDDSARVDWLTANHFMDMTGNANLGVTLSNADSFIFKLGNSIATSLDINTPKLSLLAVGRMTSENPIHNQAGDSAFRHRYALRTHGGFDQTAAMKFSLEHQNPLVTSTVNGTFSGATLYPATTYSFVSISDPDVLLWALKPHEEGIANGVTARTWNMAATAPVLLDFASDVNAARRMTHTERALGTATVTGQNLSFIAGEQQMQTHLAFLGNQLTGYDAWKVQKFTLPEQGQASISSPTADPDGDGCENLKEYAFLTEPKLPQSCQTPPSEITVSGQKHLAISFPQRSDALDVVYTIRVSTDLETWTDIGQVVGGEGSGPAFLGSNGLGQKTTIQAKDLLPLSTGPRRFLKVEVRK